MSCRSSSKRANTNARHIAKRAARPGSNALRWIGREGGAFTDTLARTFALHKTTYPVDPERCDDANWSLVSELMNRAVVPRSPKRSNVTRERYGQIGPPPEYVSINEVRERAARLPRVVEEW